MILVLPSPFFPGILLSRKPPETQGNGEPAGVQKERWSERMDSESTLRMIGIDFPGSPPSTQPIHIQPIGSSPPIHPLGSSPVHPGLARAALRGARREEAQRRLRGLWQLLSGRRAGSLRAPSFWLAFEDGARRETAIFGGPLKMTYSAIHWLKRRFEGMIKGGPHGGDDLKTHLENDS